MSELHIETESPDIFVSKIQSCMVKINATYTIKQFLAVMYIHNMYLSLHAGGKLGIVVHCHILFFGLS